MLHVGSVAPDFTLPDQHGNLVHLADLLGSWVLLWWYPKAQTPGCTVEGQCLRDNAHVFEEFGAVVLGASFDTPAENLAFATIQEFPFQLLSDVDHHVGTAYEVVRDHDDKYAGYPRRFSYLIDPKGVIARAYDVTDVTAHADHVLRDLVEAGATRA